MLSTYSLRFSKAVLSEMLLFQKQFQKRVPQSEKTHFRDTHFCDYGQFFADFSCPKDSQIWPNIKKICHNMTNRLIVVFHPVGPVKIHFCIIWSQNLISRTPDDRQHIFFWFFSMTFITSTSDKNFKALSQLLNFWDFS